MDDARAGCPGRDGGWTAGTADVHRPPCPDFQDENNNDAQCWRGANEGPPALLYGALDFLHSWNLIPDSTFHICGIVLRKCSQAAERGRRGADGQRREPLRRTAPACGVGSQGQRPRGVEGLGPRPTFGAADLSATPKVLRDLYLCYFCPPTLRNRLGRAL